MIAKREPVEWKYPSKKLLETPMPWDRPEYQEHLEAIGIYGERDDHPSPCEGCPYMNEFPKECPSECNYELDYRLVHKYGETASWSHEYWNQSYDALVEFANWIVSNFELRDYIEKKRNEE